MITNKSLENRNSLEHEISTHFRWIMDSSPDAVFIHDFEGKIIDVNKKAQKHLGYTKDEFRSMTIMDIDAAFPDLFVLKQEWQKLSKKETNILYGIHKRKNGSLFPVEVHLSIYEVQEKEFVIAFVKDITELKKAETDLKESRKRYQLLAENTSAGIWHASPGGSAGYVNSKLCEITGLTAEQVKGVGWTITLHPEDRERVLYEWVEFVQGKAPFHSIFRFKHINGKINWVLGQAFSIYDDEGNITGHIGSMTDITEQKNVDSELQRSYHMLESAEKVANIGSWAWILENNQVIYSDNAIKLFGLNPEDYDGKIETILNFFHPDDVKNFQNNLEEILEVKEPGIFKYRIIKPDGEIRIIEGTYRIKCDEQGNIINLEGYIQDITERTKQEGIVSASLRLIEFASNHSIKELLQKLLDETELLTDSKIGFYHILDEDQKTLLLQAWSTNTLKYMCTANVKETHYPVSKAGVWVDCIHERKPVIHNNYASLPHKKGLPEGHAPVMREMVVPVFQGNKIVSILGIGNKPTDYNKQDVKLVKALAELAWEIVVRKKAEVNTVKLSKAIEQSPESIIITDKDGKIEYVNPKYIELTGYIKKEAIGAKPNIFNIKKAGKDIYKDIWGVLQAGKVWQGEFYNTRKNGKQFWENVSVAPIKNEKEEIINFVIIEEDITEKRKILSDLKKAKEQAEESDQLKTAFLNNMSHEIRTPLNGIIGFSNMLIRSEITREQREKYSKIITKSSNRLLNIVNDILDIAKIEARQVKLHEGVVDLSQICTEILSLSFLEAKKKNIKLKNSCKGNCKHSYIIADKTRLIQILNNLINNALKFTEKGSIQINCSIKKGEIEFSVSDTGIGIDKKDHDKIFDRFRQVEFTKKGNYDGTGLGLSICKGLIEQMKGKIWLESELGKGSTFFFTIPYKPVKKPQNKS